MLEKVDKHIFAVNLVNGTSIFIPDTWEERTQAIEQGYTAFTPYSFEFEPTDENIRKHGREPIMYGNLWIYLTIGNIAEAIGAVKEFIQFCEFQYRGFQKGMLRYFIKGGTECHICIPSKVFGGDDGHIDLHLLHYKFIRSLESSICNTPNKETAAILQYIDKSMYIQHISQLVRDSRLLSTGNDKIELLASQFFDYLPDMLRSLDEPGQARQLEIMAPVETDMKRQFRKVCVISELVNKIPTFSHLLKCSFIEHCLHSWDMTDEQWFILFRYLKQYGELGRQFAHKLWEDYEGYSADDIDKRYSEVLQYNIPTCDEVKNCYACPTDCKCNSLEIKNNTDNVEASDQSFICTNEALYYSKSQGAEDDMIAISSPLKILGYIHDSNKTRWERLFEVTNPLGGSQRISVPFQDCIGRCEGLISQLSHYGWLPKVKNITQLLCEYITKHTPDKYYIKTSKIGWHNEIYVLPDKIYGKTDTQELIFEDKSSLFNVRGTHQEWVDNIGKYCHKNPLVMFLVQYALTGPLLKLLGIEGGGIHLYAPSSSGKSTLAAIAGSVCGGTPEHGFLRQWRATANSLERVACLHNDNLLILDELGQATADAVFDTTYMLSNSQGKIRMNSRSGLQNTFTWNINYLSTGEITIEQKIGDGYKKKPMAGQLNRIIDIPLDYGDGRNVFQELHNFENPAKLGIYLKEASKLYYGTALRLFLEALTSDDNLERNIEQIRNYIDDFVNKNTSASTNGQVVRVTYRIALVSAVGRFAAAYGIFPWTPDEAEKAVQQLYNLWLEKRGGDKNLEVEKAICNVFEYIEEYGPTRFINPDDSTDITRLPNFSGYKESELSSTIYYIQTTRFRNLVGVNHYAAVIKEMVNRGMIEMDKTGKKVREFYHPASTFGHSRDKIRAHGIIIKKDNEDMALNKKRTQPPIFIDDITSWGAAF